MAQPAKRRIQPQLISPSHAQPSAISDNISSIGLRSSGPSHILPQAQATGAINAAQRIPDPKEDSDTAARLGMKGRKVYVTLQKGQSNDVNLRKVENTQKQQILPDICRLVAAQMCISDSFLCLQILKAQGISGSIHVQANGSLPEIPGIPNVSFSESHSHLVEIMKPKSD